MAEIATKESSNQTPEKKSQDDADKWKNIAALSTVILAVGATLATFRSGGASTKTVLKQAEITDAWAYYQSKSIKQNLYEVQKETLEAEVAHMPSNAQEHVNKRIAVFSSKIAKYEKEKKEVMEQARAFERERDRMQKSWSVFGIAVVFLQLAILISSVGVLMKIRNLWLGSLALGVVGLVYFANAFFLWF